MLKKLIKMSVVVSLMVTTMTAFAQNTGKPEYPRYGFWSNWSIGGSFDLNHELQQGYPLFGHGWRVTTNAGMDIFAQQKMNHVFDWRIRFGFPSFGKPFADKTGREVIDGNDTASYTLNRNFTLTADLLISLNDAIKGYDPDRKWSIYIFGGVGARFNGLSAEERANTYASSVDHGVANIMATFGQGLRFKVGDKGSIFCEYSFDAADIVNIFKQDFYNGWQDVNSIVRLGYAHSLGITAADQAIAAQKAMLTQENVNALNTQVNNLENQVQNARNNEKKLQNRVKELEDQLAQAQNGAGKANANANSDLQKTIDQIKADQLNFYAMPFSIQYGVNEWQVSEEEMDKVKAVARVLKDNSSAKITVVGFADYTGSDAYNMKLSEKRANEVKRLLVKKYGIAEDRISTDYKGKSVAFGDIQYALNRRVSFYRVIE